MAIQDAHRARPAAAAAVRECLASMLACTSSCPLPQGRCVSIQQGLHVPGCPQPHRLPAQPSEGPERPPLSQARPAALRCAGRGRSRRCQQTLHIGQRWPPWHAASLSHAGVVTVWSRATVAGRSRRQQRRLRNRDSQKCLECPHTSLEAEAGAPEWGARV
jgi:hypothetical protein